MEKKNVFRVVQSRFDVPKDDSVCPYCQEAMDMKTAPSKEDAALLNKAKEDNNDQEILKIELKYEPTEVSKTDNISCKCAKIPCKLQTCGHHVHVGCYISAAVFNEHKQCPTCTQVPEAIRS